VEAKAEPEPAPVPWALVYHRACQDSITPPVLSVDGRTVASCGSLFDVGEGRFTGKAPFSVMAFLPGGRAIVDDLQDGGLTVVGPGPGDRRHGPGGRPTLATVAPDGARVVSFETEDERHTLVVRKLPSLERVRATALDRGAGTQAVGFLADGREAVVADHGCVVEKCKGRAARGCSETRCSDRAILAVDGGALVPLVSGVARAVIGARGDVAAVLREDGSAALVALPDGRTLAPLPPPEPGKEVEAIAVSPAGDRVALAVAGKLTVLARRGDAFVEVLSAPRGFTRALRFAPDGRTLFTGDDLAAYREGASPWVEGPLPYPVTLPKGFALLERRGSSWRVPGNEDREWGSSEETQAMYFHERLGATVRLIALDPAEIGREGDAEAWALRAAARAFPHLPLATAAERAKAAFAAWGDPERGRAMEVRWHDVGGCDEESGYGRIAERDGHTYLVRIEVPGDLKPARVAPWLNAFFDAPLGLHPARTAAPAHAPGEHRASPRPRHRKKRRHRER
jgi:hypothetical protein